MESAPWPGWRQRNVAKAWKRGVFGLHAGHCVCGLRMNKLIGRTSRRLCTFSTSIREIREIKYYFNIWGIRKRKERRGLRKRGVKIHPFHLPWIRAWVKRQNLRDCEEADEENEIFAISCLDSFFNTQARRRPTIHSNHWQIPMLHCSVPPRRPSWKVERSVASSRREIISKYVYLQ